MPSEIGFEVLWFIFMGLLGGVTYVIINSDEIGDLTLYSALQRYALGAISGFIYNILYSEYNFPNSIMCFVSGYMGTTFIEALMRRLAPKPDSG